MKNLLLLSLVLLSLPSFGQDNTTFILVRHAEKATDDPKDPDLSPEGITRVSKLAELLEQSSITAVYSTPYKRTRKTVQAIANSKKLTVQEYAPTNPASFVAELLAKHAGGTVLISGHSNTIPSLANALLGKETFKQFDDADYGNLLIITVHASGQSSLLHLRF
jgi:broad specificity phosphatase PhoE